MGALPNISIVVLQVTYFTIPAVEGKKVKFGGVVAWREFQFDRGFGPCPKGRVGASQIGISDGAAGVDLFLRPPSIVGGVAVVGDGLVGTVLDQFNIVDPPAGGIGPIGERAAETQNQSAALIVGKGLGHPRLCETGVVPIAFIATNALGTVRAVRGVGAGPTVHITKISALGLQKALFALPVVKVVIVK